MLWLPKRKQIYVKQVNNLNKYFCEILIQYKLMTINLALVDPAFSISELIKHNT